MRAATGELQPLGNASKDTLTCTSALLRSQDALEGCEALKG